MDEDEDFVLVPKHGQETDSQELFRGPLEYLPSIDHCIRGLHDALWQLNTFIHNNPELGFNEHRAHDALVNFMSSRGDWKVTSSAYGMTTAWESVFDTGRPGPGVSFNVEMGMFP